MISVKCTDINKNKLKLKKLTPKKQEEIGGL